MRIRKLISVMGVLILLTAACATAQTPTEAPNFIVPATTSPTPVSTAAPTQPVPTPTQTLSPKPSPTSAGAWMQLQPDTAKPGDTVKIEGYLPGGPDQQAAQQDQSLANATVCWQGCLSGLTDEGLPVTWSASQPGNFSLSFQVPTVPWLSDQGPQPLQTGDYTVGLQCLGPGLNGCALQEAQITATLHLEGPTPSTCQENQPCANLVFTPDQGGPGTQVQVKGWAPLTGLVGSGASQEALGYSLGLETPGAQAPANLGQISQSPDGSINGSFVVPETIPGGGALPPGKVTLGLDPVWPKPGRPPSPQAETPFTVTTSLSWSGLNLGQPLWIEPSAVRVGSSFTINPPQTGRIAFCAPGSIQISDDGGKSWNSIPVGSVADALKGTNYALFSQNSNGQMQCTSVTLDPDRPDSVFAVFQTMAQQYGAPPVFFMGFYSTDAGKTWQTVSPPQASDLEHFGNFWSNGQDVVQALFSSTTQSSSGQPLDLVQQTTDGGNSWTLADLQCPASGPCVRWGAAPGSIPGMGSPLPQAVQVSNDGGKTWEPSGPTVELRLLDPKELVAFSPDTAALVAGSQDFPLQVTQDGGKTWQVIGLPALPGTSGEPPQFSGLQILPDGSLIALVQENSSWMRLDPQTQNWCQLSSNTLPQGPALILAQGDQAWWVAESGERLQHAPLSAFSCGG